MNSPAGLAHGRKVPAATAAAFLILGLGGVIAPPAQAADQGTVTGGALEWGFKQSFRSYITGKIAGGQIDTAAGASYNGSTFSLAPVAGGTTVSGDAQATVQLQGELHFSGHRDGDISILDTTMSDFKIRLDGQQAEIIVDLIAREFKGTNYDSVGEFITTDDVPLATVTLDSTPNFTTDSIDLAGTAVLTSAGAQAFGGFYDAGEPLDNTGGTLLLDGAIGTSGAGGRTASAGATQNCDSGALGAVSDDTEREGALGMVQQVNDTFALWNNLLVNTERMFCNMDSLQNRFKPQAPAENNTEGGAAATTPSAGPPAENLQEAAPAAQSAGHLPVTAPAGGTGNSPAAATYATQGGAGASVCVAEDALGVIEASASWGIKQSFQNYIRGSIAKGQWSLSGVGYDNQQFLFAGTTGSVTPATQSGSILFPGILNFTGHGGTLGLQMSNVEIRFASSSGEVIADITSSDMSGTSTAFGRTILGSLAFNSLDVSDTQVAGDAAVTLTAAGSQAFADFYEPGQQLDPISFQAQLGGAANCAAAQGEAASGAAISGVSGGGLSTLPDTALAATGNAEAATLYGDSTSGTGVDAAADQDGQFQIRSVGKEANTLASFTLDTPTTVGLIIVAFIVAGGSMTRFTTANTVG